MKVIEEFHYEGEFYKQLNNIFITLIPKKKDAKELKDFRPTSLLSSVYKIILKVLTAKLKQVMGSIISEPQSAFVASRQIFDGVLIANECVDDRLKAGRQGSLCTLDLEKAYDHVN